MEIHDNQHLLRRQSSYYNWEACPLTINLMAEGRSVRMQECLARLANWHMKGDSDARTGYEIVEGIEVSVERRTDPPPGFSDIKNFLARLNSEQWTDEDNHPPRDVQITSRINPMPVVRQDPEIGEIQEYPWTLWHNALLIHDLPESLIHATATGTMTLDDFLKAPYLKGFEIERFSWKGKSWSNSKNPQFEEAPNRRGFWIHFKEIGFRKITIRT